jgi:hypothetical protein
MAAEESPQFLWTTSKRVDTSADLLFRSAALQGRALAAACPACDVHDESDSRFLNLFQRYQLRGGYGFGG